MSEAQDGGRNEVSVVAFSGTKLLQHPVPRFPSFLWGGVTALPSLLKAAFLSSPTLSWTVLRVFMSLGALLNEPPKAGGDFHPPALPETCLMLVLGSSFLHLQQEQ